MSLQPGNQNGLVSYQALLPASAALGGDYSIATANETAAVGFFFDTGTIPAPITITSNLQPGTSISLPFTLKWKGGDSGSVVAVQLNVTIAGQQVPYIISASSSASDGSRTLQVPPPEAAFSLPPQADAEVIVTQQAAEAAPNPFSAPGLTLGGAQTWSYLFDFKGLKTQ